MDKTHDSGASIRIVLADDHTVVREGIRALLEREDGLTVVGVAADGDQAVQLCAELRPDVAVLDISMPGTTGLQAARDVKAGLAPAVLILSMHDEPEMVVEAVRAGADGYVLKDSDPKELSRAVRAVAAGRRFFPAGTLDRLQEGVRREEERQRAGAQLEGLTAREMQVLLRVARGFTNREIAEGLSISPRTVESHRERVMGKTGVRTVAGLTRLVLEMGLDTV
ncbi:MAG: response regulator transcription factor [Longimicrobiales bacterium]